MEELKVFLKKVFFVRKSFFGSYFFHFFIFLRERGSPLLAVLFLTTTTLSHKSKTKPNKQKTSSPQVVLQALMRATDLATARSVEVVGARADLATGRVAVLRTAWVSARGGALYE